MSGIVNWIATTFAGWDHELLIFIISLFPILELRGGMIAAALLGVPYLKALIICVIGNILPIPFILLLIEKIFDFLRRFKTTGRFVNFLETKTMKKRDKIDKWGFWGLVLFTGIPLPGTGGWTGALLASLLRIPVKKSAPAIGLGICLAAAIMSFITYGIPWIVSLF
ncbi:MAG: small multi-drug export protein [Parasporobacterium sp.]|nr:small multi-drug export protein [Parasporobacterium sp.]